MTVEEIRTIKSTCTECGTDYRLKLCDCWKCPDCGQTETWCDGTCEGKA